MAKRSKNQVSKFKEAARALGAEKSERQFDKTLKKLTRPKAKRTKKKPRATQG